MMSADNYQDRTLTCRDCGQEFTFTAGEQEFYASRGLTNEPGRCPECRAARKQSGGGRRNSSYGDSSYEYRDRAPRQMYTATCASCGNEAQVPFQPRDDRPVYCSDCFQSQRPARGREDSYSYSSDSRGRGRGGRRNDRDSRW
ncbi:MAG TPA: zinc-ribbon domain containing protein [Ktedonobacteraceae bacterium]|nr:zinc-ribbon domain containing protein [Ktedonobacteraceae bacterium]